MKLNLLKGFAAVTMLCMIGTVLAESVAVGDIGAYLAYKHHDGAGTIVKAGEVFTTVGGGAILGATTIGEVLGVSATLVGWTGVGLVAVGLCAVA